MTDSVKVPARRITHPKAWYNLQADLPKPLPAVLHPGTGQPIGPEDLLPLFPMSLIAQEVSTEREIEIPGPVRDVYRQWRVTPLYRARRLEKVLQTPARIYYKYEGVSPAAATSPTPRFRRRSTTRRPASSAWRPKPAPGSGAARSRSPARCSDSRCRCSWSASRYDQKPYRRALMETYGARCTPSPSNETASGRAILAQRADHPGSLGIAISEAVEVAAQREDTKYALGSVLNHVLLHQTVIGSRRWSRWRWPATTPT